MTTATEPARAYTIGQLVKRYNGNATEHMIRRVIDRLGLDIGEGYCRIVSAADLAAVDLGMKAAGYLGQPPRRRSSR